jgi:hypothetical protein
MKHWNQKSEILYIERPITSTLNIYFHIVQNFEVTSEKFDIESVLREIIHRNRLLKHIIIIVLVRFVIQTEESEVK